MDHVYWIAQCKTPNCIAYHRASYIGHLDWTTDFALPEGLPQWWDYRCEQCGRVHRYTPEDLTPYTQADGPQPDWIPWF